MCVRREFRRVQPRAQANECRERNRGATRNRARLRVPRFRGVLSREPSGLEFYVALRRLDVFEQSVDDLLHRDSLRFRREVRKHAMTQHRTRDANYVLRRNSKSSGKQCMRFCAEYQRLSRARACSPANVFLHHLGRV